jgi:outer membrane protein OmpA-like peptidoglycan-associated protein
MRPALLPATALSALALLLPACAGVRPAGAPAEPAAGEVLREAELARVRCLLVAPFENASDSPLAASVATRALLSWIDPGRTQVLPVEALRALFDDTPLELPEGVTGATAVELAELLGGDAALHGTVDGRAHDREPSLLVTVRLALAGQRDLVFATTVGVVPQPGEPLEAAVRRAVLERARPMLDRLGAPGRRQCFPQHRRDALRAAAEGLRPPAAPPPSRAEPAPPRPAPPAAPGGPRGALRTQRQRDWARRLAEGNRVVLEDVTFAGRTALLAREAGLADLAVVLAASPGLQVRLEGFVDTSGDPALDARLSLDMARAASQRLADLGVEAGRVVAAGRGGESPILPNFTVRGRAANRRIEVAPPR